MVKAAVFEKANEPLVLREFPRPQVEENAVLAKVSSAGICGTDIHVWSGKVPWVKCPVILGHESVGIVEELGKNIAQDSVGKPLAKGDRIYWAIGITCGRCYFCLRNTPTRCLNRKAIGLSTPCDKPPHLFGGFAEYAYLPAGTYIFKVPDELPTLAISAVGCAGPTMIAGSENVGIELNDIVAIQGSGPIGMFGLTLAMERGALETIMIGGPKKRLELAKKIGATHLIDINEMKDPVERARTVKELTEGYGPDLVMECTGVPTAIQEAISMIRDGGRILEVGAYADYGPVQVNPYYITSRQVKIVGSYSKVARHEFEFIRFMSKKWKKYPFQEMVSHKFPLERINEAFEAQKNLAGMKVVVLPHGEPLK